MKVVRALLRSDGLEATLPPVGDRHNPGAGGIGTARRHGTSGLCHASVGSDSPDYALLGLLIAGPIAAAVCTG